MNRTRRWSTRMGVLALGLGLVGPIPAGHASEGAWLRATFTDPIVQGDHDALIAAGAALLQPVPGNAYLVWAADGTLNNVPGATISPLPTAERIDPWAARASRLVVLLPASLRARTATDLGRLGSVIDVAPAHPEDPLAEIVVEGVDAATIASRPETLYVGPTPVRLVPEDEASSQVQAGNLSGLRPVPGYRAWLDSVGVDGTGERATIVDTGVDDLHPDLQARMAGSFHYGNVAEPRDVGGHGTHVAGIVAADGTLDLPATTADSDGFRYGLGVAPGATLLNQALIAATRGAFVFKEVSRDAVRNGATVWNASWHTGEGTGVGYLASSRTLDLLVRDADWETPGAEPLTMVFSAGNAGPGNGTMTSPKEAKNLITVANSLSHRAGSIHAIASSSSRGPAVDGRILPTVTAPGSSIISTRAMPAGASCGVPVATAPMYSSCTGTSMAAPHVTGAALLTTEWWRQRNDGEAPSPAMLKALLVNSARDLGLKDVPNTHEGWGRVDLGALFDAGSERIYVDQTVVFTDPGDSLTIDVEPVDPTRPVRVSLVWTDPAATPHANPALVNDLDLTVSGDQVYLGNVYDEGRSVPGGSSDRLNNVENVSIEDPQGSYQVTVSSVALPGDGVPFDGDDTDQDFALVITNARAV